MTDSDYTIASFDMAPLSEEAPGFQPSLQALAEELGDLAPDGVCIRGATSTAALRALNAYLVRKRSRLLRMSTAREDPRTTTSRHLAVIYRQTNLVARAFEHHGERIALAVNVIDPKLQLAVARGDLAHVDLDGSRAIVCAPAGTDLGGLGDGLTPLAGEEGGDAMVARGVEPIEHGLVLPEAPVAVPITWQRVGLTE